MNDYRCSNYCKPFINISQKKLVFVNKYFTSRITNHYRHVMKMGSEEKKEFFGIYNYKCAYCGASIFISNIDLFEIDHFLTQYRHKNGNISNLVASCQSCNRLKSNFIITKNNAKLFDIESSLPKLYYRSEDYYILINEDNKKNNDVIEFYNKLHLGYEVKRLDYILMELHGMLFDNKFSKIRDELNIIFIKLKDKRSLISSFQ